MTTPFEQALAELQAELGIQPGTVDAFVLENIQVKHEAMGKPNCGHLHNVCGMWLHHHIACKCHECDYGNKMGLTKVDTWNG